MIIINPGSKTGGGTEAQALENARQWLRDMRANGITDPSIVLVEEPVRFDERRWTFTFRHLLTGVECALSIHGLIEEEADAFMFRPRVYWKGSSCSTPDPLDWTAPGYVLAIIPEQSAAMSDSTQQVVRVGQVWQSTDPRYSEENQRTVRVLRLEDKSLGFPERRFTHARCEGVWAVSGGGYMRNPSTSGRESSIRLDRFRPGSRGYRLISEES